MLWGRNQKEISGMISAALPSDFHRFFVASSQGHLTAIVGAFRSLDELLRIPIPAVTIKRSALPVQQPNGLI
jgi:hypothetical protein